MKMLFVYPTARDTSTPPIGIGYLCSFLRGKGHQVKVLDISVKPLSAEELSKAIEGFNNYDCIGISAIITAYNFVKSFSKEVKKRFPQLPIVVGNAISIACPGTLLKNSKADVVVVDEGELTLAELLQNIKHPEKFKDIKGIWYKDEKGEIFKTPPRERIEDLDSLPYPAWDLMNIPVYMSNASPYIDRGIRTGWISAVRGCPFRCGYCSRPFGQKITYRSANGVIDEILEFRRIYKNTHIKIPDDEFMVNKRVVRNFARALLERKVKITWEANGRVNFAGDGDLLKLMRKSGCVCLGYGIESGSQKILDNMNKGATVEQARKAIELTRKTGIRMNTPMMFGYIGEDRHTAYESLNFIKEMRLRTTRLFFSTPYPGTPLYDWARKNNRIKWDEDTYVSLLGNNAENFLVNLTEMSDEEYLRLKAEIEQKARRAFPLGVKIDNCIIKRIFYIRARMLQLGFIGTVKKIVKKLRGFNKAN